MADINRELKCMAPIPFDNPLIANRPSHSRGAHAYDERCVQLRNTFLCVGCHGAYLACAESTNQRVFWYSLLSVSVIVLNATWQILYLKRDFKKKKLI